MAEKRYNEEANKWLRTQLKNPELKFAKTMRKLKKDSILRKILILTYLSGPCRIGEIERLCKSTRTTIYNKWGHLVKNRIAEKILIKNVFKKKSRNEWEREALKKYREWTYYVAKKTEKFYRSKTNYFYVKEEAEELVGLALKIERETECQNTTIL